METFPLEMGRAGVVITVKACNNELLISPEDLCWRRQHGICLWVTRGGGEEENPLLCRGSVKTRVRAPGRESRAKIGRQEQK